MTSTVYTDYVGPAVNAAWLNDLNAVGYGTPPARGTVVLCLNKFGVWSLYDYNGVPVSITASTTGGIQEALNYLPTHPVWIGGAGTINISTSITIPASYKGNLWVGQEITINCTASLGAASCVVMDSQENCKLQFHAVIVQYPGDTGPTVTIQPKTAAPVTGNITIAASSIELGTTAPATTGGGTQLDPTFGGIIGNSISFDDSNGGLYALRVLNPTSSLIVIEENFFDFKYFHKFTSYGIEIGNSVTNQGNLRKNTWRCGRLAANGAASVALLTYGQNDLFVGFGANNEEGTLNYGIIFQTGAVGNTVIGTAISGAVTAAVTDLSGGANSVTLGGLCYGLQEAGGSASGFYPMGQITAQLVGAQTAANTTETTLQTYTLPANALNALGRGVRIRAWGNFGANADSKTVRLYFGGAAIVTSTALTQNGTSWVATAEVYRTSSNNQTYWGNFIAGNSDIGVQSGTTTSVDSNTIILKVTGQNGVATAGDIVCNGMTIDSIV